MNATRSFLAAMVLVFAISANQASAQCSGNAGGCLTVNTASATVNALVKLGMSTTATTLSSPTADQVDIGATLADAGPSFTIKANRSWTLNIRTSNASNWTYVGSNGGTKPISDLTWSNAVAGTNGTAAQAFFKTVWAAGFTQPSNAPGAYSLPVVFSLSAP